MNSESNNLVIKVPECNELPSLRLTQVAGVRKATPMKDSGTTRLVEAGFSSTAGASEAGLGPSKGVSERRSSTGSLFGPQGPGTGRTKQ